MVGVEVLRPQRCYRLPQARLLEEVSAVWSEKVQAALARRRSSLSAPNMTCDCPGMIVTAAGRDLFIMLGSVLPRVWEG